MHFSRYVPERLVNPTLNCGLNRTAAIEGAPLYCLPVEGNAGRVLADEIVAYFKRASCASFGVVFQHLAPACDPGIGGDFDEDPGILKNEAFDLCNFDLVFRTNGCCIGSLSREG